MVNYYLKNNITGNLALRDSIVVSVSACHADDPGSIPGRGVLFSLWRWRKERPVSFRISNFGMLLVDIAPWASRTIALTIFQNIKMHPPEIEPGSQRWRRCILPLDHGCLAKIRARTRNKHTHGWNNSTNATMRRHPENNHSLQYKIYWLFVTTTANMIPYPSRARGLIAQLVRAFG